MPDVGESSTAGIPLSLRSTNIVLDQLLSLAESASTAGTDIPMSIMTDNQLVDTCIRHDKTSKAMISGCSETGGAASETQCNPRESVSQPRQWEVATTLLHDRPTSPLIAWEMSPTLSRVEGQSGTDENSSVFRPPLLNSGEGPNQHSVDDFE